MLYTNQKIEDFILCHIDDESPVLAELNRQTHLKLLNPRMLSGHAQGVMLRFISKIVHASRILEVGTFSGYSAICLAEGLAEGGLLHTIDNNDEIKEFAWSFFVKAGVEKKIIMHTGDAKRIIPDLEDCFELIFLDADKENYPLYYDMLIEKLTPGGVLLADNVFWDGKVLEPVTDEETAGIVEFCRKAKSDPRVETTIIPVRDGLMMIRKKTD